MKKIILAVIMLASLLLLVATSSYSMIHNQSACTIDGVADESIEVTGDVACETEANSVISEAEADYSQDAVVEAGVTEQMTEEEQVCSLTENALANDNHQEACPIPDGRIYYTPEGPYPYIPTWTPKDPWGIPVTPLEPVN